MNSIHGIKPDNLTCQCGANGDDLRIISAVNGKLTIRCRKCKRSATVHLCEPEPDLSNTRTFTEITADLEGIFGLQQTQDRRNRAYAAAKGWERP